MTPNFFFVWLSIYIKSNFYVIYASILLIICILLSVAFFTLLERKKLASLQRRKGPNVEGGVLGVVQPIMDGFKLVFKEVVIPNNSILIIFVVSPVLAFCLGFASWCLLPFGNYILANVNLGLFFIFIISVLHVYSIILAGWSSNSKYSFFGALRSSAQLIAYDISMGLIILVLIIPVKSFNLLDIVIFQKEIGWFVFYHPVLFIIFFICALAETNRHPFDLPEAEAELVSGYNVEYSALGFALFFLGEYASILFMSLLICNLFLGGTWIFSPLYLSSFSEIFYSFTILKILVNILKPTVIVFMFLVIRAAIPRYRYDHLMHIGWKMVLPIVLSIFIYNLSVMYFMGTFSSESLDYKKFV